RIDDLGRPVLAPRSQRHDVPLRQPRIDAGAVLLELRREEARIPHLEVVYVLLGHDAPSAERWNGEICHAPDPKTPPAKPVGVGRRYSWSAFSDDRSSGDALKPIEEERIAIGRDRAPLVVPLELVDPHQLD